MVIVELFINYWLWHYTLAIKNIFIILRDFVRHLWNYFSISQLARTFFVPWKRLREERMGGLEVFDYFSSVVITLLMRVVGIVVRTVVIAVGLLSIVLTIIFGLGFVAVWLFMPLVILIMFTVGVQLALKQF